MYFLANKSIEVAKWITSFAVNPLSFKFVVASLHPFCDYMHDSMKVCSDIILTGDMDQFAILQFATFHKAA